MTKAIPESDQFWVSDVGLTVVDILLTCKQLFSDHSSVLTKKTYGKYLAKNAFKLDAAYLALSAGGLAISMASLWASGTIAILMSILGAIFTFAGAYLVFKGQDIFDLTDKFNPFSEFDEFMTQWVFVPMAVANIAFTLVEEA